MGKLLIHIIVSALWLTLISNSTLHAQDMRDYDRSKGQIANVHLQLQKEAYGIRYPAPLAGIVSPLFSIPTEVEHIGHATPNLLPQGTIELIDLRLALVQLSFAVGSNGQISVVRAQSDPAPRVIAIQNGSVTLSDLREWVKLQADTSLSIDKDILRVPLVIFQDARFDFEPGDTLKLSKEDGAFIANFGTLIVEDAAISVTHSTNQRVPEYAPFITTAGSGFAQFSNALLEGLGFGETVAFSGMSVINRGLYEPIGRSSLVSSVLRDTQSVTFEGGNSPTILGNAFVGNAAGDLVLRNTRNAEIRFNIFADNTDGVALKVTDGALATTVSNNLILNSAKAGISISRASNNSVITENLIWKSKGAGISISRSDCVQVSNNISIDNQQKGIELRNGRQAQIIGNQMLGNQSAGLFIADQPIGNKTIVNSNVFLGNHTGISSASAAQLSLLNNNFLHQFPRFLNGDMASQVSKILVDLQGSEGFDLTAGGIELFNLSPLNCSLEMDG